MQKAEIFIREFFRARIVEERRIQESRAPFRRKFFTDNCRWDSRSGTLEMMQSEEVVSVEATESEPKIITAYNIPYAGGFRRNRLRYHLRPVKDAWLIRFVERECPACAGHGDDTCAYCKGKHWLSTEKVQG